MNAQFKKGVLELCALALLDKRDYYGYELVQVIYETIEIAQGTIYPLLKRLRDDGMVTIYLEESLDGPPRKYYKITDKGKEAYQMVRTDWIQFAQNVNKLLNAKDE
jgi:PadR family transcriptional regulator PadR